MLAQNPGVAKLPTRSSRPPWLAGRLYCPGARLPGTFHRTLSGGFLCTARALTCGWLGHHYLLRAVLYGDTGGLRSSHALVCPAGRSERKREAHIGAESDHL